MGSRIRDPLALMEARVNGRECALCGCTSRLQVHHIVFKSHLGDDVSANLVMLCQPCHDALHAYDPDTWIKLEDYVLKHRPDTVAYLEEKLKTGLAGFFPA